MAVKTALVTGGSRGIGLAVARMLISEGWLVAVLSRTRPPRDLEAAWIKADVATFAPPAPEWHPLELDALVHCAAIQGPVGPLAECDPQAWAETIATNLIGTYHAVRAALPSLRRSEDGRILLFSGGGAFGPRENHTAYAASKSGVVALMETLAVELRHSTVTVNCVAPGYVPTTLHADPVDDDGEAMRRAVACVRHLLGSTAHGLTGRTISAAFDDWASIDQTNVDRLNMSPMGTRRREPIALVGRLRRAV